MSNVTIYHFARDDWQPPKGKEWLMTAGIDDEGTIYAPCVSDMDGLCAMFDGVSMVQHDDHLYLPLSWQIQLAQEKLRTAKGKERRELQHLLDVSFPHMEREVRRAHAGQEANQ